MAFRWALGLSLLVMLSTVLPYAYHAARPVPGRVYSGVEAFPIDTVTYLMWISQARRGNLLVSDQYSVEGTDAMLPNPLWAAVGLVGRLLPGEAITLYHGARVLLGLGYLLLLWAFVRRLYQDALAQWTAWLFTALGGGVAWLYFLHTGSGDLKGMWVTADYMPEMWSYSSLLYFPHFAAGLLLLVGCSCACGVAPRSPKHRGGGWLLTRPAGLVHTYTAVTAVVTLLLQSALWLAVSRRGAAVVANVLLILSAHPLHAPGHQVHVSPPCRSGPKAT